MSAAEITAVASLLVALGTLAKLVFDSVQRGKRQAQQAVARTEAAAFERLTAEVSRLDARLIQYEARHESDLRRIAELETGRLKREVQLTELGARISTVDDKVGLLQTGIFAKFERGELK